MKIAINGCGIAGPTLAWWLERAGHEPVLFEEAPQLRSGGYVIDFWGLGYDIADRMGLIPAIRERGYQVQEVRMVGPDGRKTGGFGTGVFERMTDGRFTSLRRSDLAAVLHGAVSDRVETVFGDAVEGLEQDDDGVDVTLRSGKSGRFDLVIGADGLHSAVRRIAFGPEEQFEKRLGYHVAAFEMEGYRPRDELVYVSYTEPGRQIARFAMRDDRTLFLLVFRDDRIPGGADMADPQAVLNQVYAGAGWEAPAILSAMDGRDDLYFDRVSQIRMDHWTMGRVALLGDAAACVSLLAGEGTGLAMTEAYVLAGELSRPNASHGDAFRAYTQRLEPFLRRKQESARNFAKAFAPKTGTGIAFRNLVTRLMAIPAVADWFIGRDLRDDIDLPEY